MTCGLLLLDKPSGISSQAVVSHLRKNLKISKIGHLGTLDPFATGLLPIMLGGATRLADELMLGEKQYLFTISLGTETDTLDAYGQVKKQEPVPTEFPQLLEKILPKFIGEIEQIPPIYSALKMHGKPLYAYMRGTGHLPMPIETKKRIVRIEKLEIINFAAQENTITLRVLCSKGTYVRSLARDLAASIGTVGFCSALRREKVGPWSVENAPVIPGPGLRRNDQGIQEQALDINALNILSPEQMLPTVPKLILSSSYEKQLSSGNIIFLTKDELKEECFAPRSASEKIFSGIQGSKILFLSEIEKQDNILKIKPRKKII